jgi:hypothetical protein
MCVYYTLSHFFPAKRTYFEKKPVLPGDEVVPTENSSFDETAEGMKWDTEKGHAGVEVKALAN